jgi:FSR family fosmidomycin resistance protein-like MFS transporter
MSASLDYLEDRNKKQLSLGPEKRITIFMVRHVETNKNPTAGTERIGIKVLGAISFAHFLNDLIQSLIPAIYPLLKDSFSLNFTQIGLITLTFQMSASLLQPAVGLYTDRHP